MRTNDVATEPVSTRLAQSDYDRLKKRANSAGHSLAEEVRRIVSADVSPMSPGVYVSTFYRAHKGDRAAKEMLRRTIDDTATGDIPGLLPQGIGSGLVAFVDANRYAVNHSRKLNAPAKGSTWLRPRATQMPLVDEQDAELAELPSLGVVTEGKTVGWGAPLGGVYLMPEQVLDWSEPETLDELVDLFALRYATESEAKVCTAIETEVTTNTVALESGANDETTRAALLDAAQAVHASCNQFADTLWLGTDAWFRILDHADNDGRPVMLDVLEDYGLTPVASPGFSPDFMAVGNADLVATYERNKGLNLARSLKEAQAKGITLGHNTAQLPQMLGVYCAYYGYIAADVKPEGLCGLVDETS